MGVVKEHRVDGERRRHRQAAAPAQAAASQQTDEDQRGRGQEQGDHLEGDQPSAEHFCSRQDDWINRRVLSMAWRTGQVDVAIALTGFERLGEDHVGGVVAANKRLRVKEQHTE